MKERESERERERGRERERERERERVAGLKQLMLYSGETENDAGWRGDRE